jgi:hypothetical protein
MGFNITSPSNQIFQVIRPQIYERAIREATDEDQSDYSYESEEIQVEEYVEESKEGSDNSRLEGLYSLNSSFAGTVPSANSSFTEGGSEQRIFSCDGKQQENHLEPPRKELGELNF